jgi:hypothetical protein
MPKTTFVATSPFTGEQFTRKSDHDYTFAVVYCDTLEKTTASLERSIKHAEDMIVKLPDSGWYTPESIERAIKREEKCIQDSLEKIANQYRREAVTFHRTSLLAFKAMAKDGKHWSETKVVPCTPRQK